ERDDVAISEGDFGSCLRGPGLDGVADGGAGAITQAVIRHHAERCESPRVIDDIGNGGNACEIARKAWCARIVAPRLSAEAHGAVIDHFKELRCRQKKGAAPEGAAPVAMREVGKRAAVRPVSSPPSPFARVAL